MSTQRIEIINEELTSVSQNAIDAVFRPWLVFLHRPLHDFFILLLILTSSTEFGAHDAADGAHWVRRKSSDKLQKERKK